MTDTQIILLVIVCIPLAMLFWCGVIGLLSLYGGWISLGKTWRTTPPTPGKEFDFASVSVGLPYAPVNYKGCVTTTVNAEGIGLSVMILFRPFHPPLFIPWSAFASVEPVRYFYMQGARLTLRDRTRRITLYGEPANAALSAYRAATGVAQA